jgi:hypothetical protein
VDYKMIAAQLSAASLSPSNPSMQPAVLPATPGTGAGLSWALVAMIAGGLIIIGALIWQMVSRRPSPDIHQPVGSRVETQSQAKFCRNCGEPVDDGDRFCSGCGLEL